MLFPADGDGEKRDAARTGLANLGFTEEQIEGDYIPAMALRNQIDVAHVDLSLYDENQRILFQKYADHAEHVFQTLLDRVLKKIEKGEFDVAEYDVKPARKDAVKIFNHLQEYADRYPG